MNIIARIVTPSVAAFLIVAAPSSSAGVPEIINYQGRVTVNGTNFDGTGHFQFALVGGGGSPAFWSNGADTVTLTVAKGLFSVLLGDTNLAGMAHPIPSALFTNADVRLRVSFNDGFSGLQLLTPDPRIGSVGYAMAAARAETASSLPPGSDMNGLRLNIGTGHILSGVLATIAGGSNNIAAGNHAVVAGGRSNSAGNSCATVGGGEYNSASGVDATIAGGNRNTAIGHSATVGGGIANNASGDSATIGGGSSNNATNSYATISGGFTNIAGSRATVGGGEFNTASGYGATIAGGVRNMATNAYATIAGGGYNTATGDAATVAGGFRNTTIGNCPTIGGGRTNFASGSYCTVAGGYNNTAQADYVTVAGGDRNIATNLCATVGGGGRNAAIGPSATIGGGEQNTASGSYDTVAGGQQNAASGGSATVGGGCTNTAGGYAATVGGGRTNIACGCAATVPGGFLNVAAGTNSFAAGCRAKALHNGAFVWGDDHNADIASTTNDQFTARCSGGVQFFSNQGATIGVQLAAGGNSWSGISDRNAKENFFPVDCGAVLEKLAAMPVTAWNLKSQDPTIRHIGPMAQDFKAAFAVGEDDRHISSSDADGVAFAAIKGLYAELQLEKARCAALEERLAELERRQVHASGAQHPFLNQPIGGGP